jgi:hypothetical protein
MVKLYYEEFPNVKDCSPLKLHKQMDHKAMEQVRKDHYLAFCKHLPICDPSLGTCFLREI